MQLHQWLEKGLTHYQHHQFAAALACFEVLLKADCDWTPWAYEMAMTGMHVNRPVIAQPFFEWIAHHPKDFPAERVLYALMFLGYIAGQQSEPEVAFKYYTQALAHQPQWWLRIRLATLLPLIYPNVEAIQHWRAKLEEQVQALLQQTVTDALFFEGVSNSCTFHLAYQGYNDCALHQQIALLHSRYLRTLPFSPPVKRAAPSPIRICLVSKYFFRHSVWFCFQGLFETLAASEDFYLIVAVSPGYKPDAQFQRLTSIAQEVLLLTGDIQDDAQRLLNTESRIVVYPELGMDPHTYALAFFQTAPISCVLPGHPVTSGVPGMHYFLSSTLLETPEAQSHYSETLILLPGLLVRYPAPVLPAVWPDREAIGLPVTGAIYMCPMAPFKLHPGFDTVLQGILQQDPTGHLVLFESAAHPNLHQLIHTRLWHAFEADQFERVHFLPWAHSEKFLALLHHATVVLDSHPFGGGNTAYLTLGVGTPVVTWPGEYLRGRSTLALYRQMDLMDCVVDGPQAYIAKALQIAHQPSYREHLHQQILAKKACVFERTDGIDAALAWFKAQVG